MYMLESFISMEQQNIKDEKWSEITKDGIAFKSERKGRLTTLAASFIITMVMEIVIMFVAIFNPAFEKVWLIFIIAIPIVIFAQVIAIHFIFSPILKILKMDDYQAGLEYNRLEEDRHRQLKERDERNK